MAYANKTISNAITGQNIRFIKTAQDTNGRLLEMEATFSPHSTEPTAHYHPNQTEDFQILSGELTVRINGKEQIFQPGDRLFIPKNTVHTMWNSSDQPTTVNWQVMPAMDTEYFFETLTGLANDGKTKANGLPSVLQLVLLANRFSRVVRLTKPGPLLQKIVFTLLTPVACLLGYRSMYPKYVDECFRKGTL